MKLLTYNFLTSASMKVVKVGYPLILHVVSKQEVETDFNPEFLTRMIPRLEWQAVLEGAKAIGCVDTLPAEPDAPTSVLRMWRMQHTSKFVYGASTYEQSCIRTFLLAEKLKFS